MKVSVLGSKGMLGRYVATYLNATPIDKSMFNALDPDFYVEYWDDATKKLVKPAELLGDVVVNCIGIIKPRIDDVGTVDTIKINSVFPHVLANYCEKTNRKLIHITTDCVFDGKKGQYYEDDPCTAQDLYGRSKLLGEPQNCTVIRTSIIGEEIGQQRSLLEWVKTQSGKTCTGFINHWWNGVTCLELSIIIEQIIHQNLFWKGVRHIFSPEDIDKHRLVELISKIYNLDVNVEVGEAFQMCDRTLRTTRPDTETILNKIPTLYEQIEMLKDFNIKEISL